MFARKNPTLPQPPGELPHFTVMLRRASCRRYSALLGIFAMLAQLLLPVAQASGMARAMGTPLAFAFCGNGSGHAATLYAQLPDEVRGALQRKQGPSITLGCPMCGAGHGAHFAGVPAIPALDLIALSHVAPAHTAPASTARTIRQTPPARAPPLPFAPIANPI